MRKILAVSLVLLFVAGTAAATCTLEILDEYVPPGFENTAYSHQMSVYGGSGPYTWSIWAGSLPAVRSPPPEENRDGARAQGASARAPCWQRAVPVLLWMYLLDDPLIR